MTDHTHCLELISELAIFHARHAVVRFPEVSNDLNRLYREGVHASKQGHFKERVFADLSFGMPCDNCGVEIEFLMFTCLGCRGMALCEPCYFEQLREIGETTDGELSSKGVTPRLGPDGDGQGPQKRKKIVNEHTKSHVFLRSYDFQTPQVHFTKKRKKTATD